MKLTRELKPYKIWKDYNESVVHVALTTDGSRALSATLDGIAYVHYVHGTGLASTQVGAHKSAHGDGAVQGVAISGDGCKAATAGMDGRVRLWDTSTASQRAAFAPAGAYVGNAADVSLCADGHTIATAFVAGGAYDELASATLAVYKLSGGVDRPAARCVAVWRTRVGRRVRVALSADGSLVAHTRAGGVAIIGIPCKRELAGWHTTGDAAIALDGPANRIAIADARALRVCAISGARKPLVLKGYLPPLEPCVTFNDEGTRVSAAVRGEAVRVWCASTGKLLFKLTGVGEDIASISLSADGSLLLGGAYNNRAYLWRLPAAKCCKNSAKSVLPAARRHTACVLFDDALEALGRSDTLLQVHAKGILVSLIGDRDLMLISKYAVSEIIADVAQKRFGTIDKELFLQCVEKIDKIVEESKKPSEEEILKKRFVGAAGHIEHALTIPVAAALLAEKSSADDQTIRTALESNSNGMCVSIEEFFEAHKQLL